MVVMVVVLWCGCNGGGVAMVVWWYGCDGGGVGVAVLMLALKWWLWWC